MPCHGYGMICGIQNFAAPFQQPLTHCELGFTLVAPDALSVFYVLHRHELSLHVASRYALAFVKYVPRQELSILVIHFVMSLLCTL